MPKFSFVVPVRNGEKTLRGTLKSISDQSRRDFELLVVDNASSDGTEQVVREFPVARLLACPTVGRSVARNMGAKNARGEWLAFVDADVILERDWLEKAEAYVDARPLDALATSVAPLGEDGGVVDAYRLRFSEWKSRGSHLSLQKFDGAFPLVNTAACLISSRSFLQVGGFDEGLRRHEDFELSLRFFFQGYLLGATTSARAGVRFLPEARFGRGLAYLRRAFEVGYLSLPGLPRPGLLNRALLDDLRKKRCGPGVLLFAVCRDIATAAGAAASRLRREPPPRWRRGVRGKKSFVCSFFHKGKLHCLRPEVSVVAIDSELFALVSPLRSRKIDGSAAEGIAGLIRGEAAGPLQARDLLKSGLFQEVG
jgi:glycosyltransferase involved in cell wall biosynthesis